MQIVCDSCGSKYSIADDKVRGKVFKIRCKECDEVIVVEGEGDADDASQMGYDDEGYGSADAAAEWYAVIDGEQVGPITPDEVEAYFHDGVLNFESYVWREGLEDWTSLSEMSEFSHLRQQGADPEAKTQVAEGLADEDETREMSRGEAETVVTDDDDFSSMFEEGVASEDAAATEEMSRSEQFDNAGLNSGGGEPSTESEPAGDLFSDFESDQEAETGEPDSVAGPGEERRSDGGGARVSSQTQSGDGDFESFGSQGVDSGTSNSARQQSGQSTSGQPDSTGAEAGASMGAGAGAQRSGEKVGERSENSVLFSLDSVDEMEAVDESKSGEDTSGAGATTEGSGLIDIQNLAASHAAMKGEGESAQTGGGGGGQQTSGGAATSGSGGQKNLSTQSMQSVPNLNPKGSRKDNTVLIAAIIAGSVVLLAALGLVGYFVIMRESQPTKVVKETATAKSESARTAQKSGKRGALGAEAESPGGADKAVGAASDEDAGTAVATAGTDAGLARADAGKSPEKMAKAEEDSEESEREKVAQRDESRDDDPGARRAPEPEPASGGSGGGGGGASGGDDDDIDSLLDNVGKEKKGGGGQQQQAQKNLPTKPSRDDVLSTIRNFSGRVSSCAANSNSNDLGGTMKIKFQIEPSGGVSTANIQTGKFQGTDVGSCVTDVVKDMEFPRTKQGMPVVFPFSIN